MRYQPKHLQARPATTRRSTTVLSAAALAATAAPVFAAAAPASAASQSVWERLAGCEASNNWHANTGNGFYGGLQFTSSTWRGFGGGAYAPRADLASESEQIAIAEKVLSVQGWGAWPACSRKLGLTAADAHSSDVSRSAARPALAPRTAKPAATPSATHVAGATYTVRRGDTLASIARSHHVAGGWQAVWSNNRNVISNPTVIRVGMRLTLPGTAAPAATKPSVKPAEKPADAAAPATGGSTVGTYTIRPGDTLSSIAAKLRIAGGWRHLYSLNADRVGANPGLIRPGTVLHY
ncbi:MAG: transglycosylase family protein [Actinomycetes bacterium]